MNLLAILCAGVEGVVIGVGAIVALFGLLGGPALFIEGRLCDGAILFVLSLQALVRANFVTMTLLFLWVLALLGGGA